MYVVCVVRSELCDCKISVRKYWNFWEAKWLGVLFLATEETWAVNVSITETVSKKYL